MKISKAAGLAAGVAVLALGGSMAFASDATPDALAAIHDKGVIEIAVYADFPPYSFGKTPAEAAGIDVEIAQAIAQRLGLKLKLRLVSAGESVSDDLRNHVWKGHYLGGGVADVMLHVGYDPIFAKREPNVVLFEPYFHETITLAYNPSRITHLESPVALTEHKIAVEGDTISDHLLSSAYGGALRGSLVREQSLAEAVAALKAGEVDGVMGPRGELEGLLREQHVGDVLFHAQDAVGQMRTAWDIGMAVKQDGGQALSDAVTKTVDRLKADGSMKKLFAAHGVKYLDANPVSSSTKTEGD